MEVVLVEKEEEVIQLQEKVIVLEEVVFVQKVFQNVLVVKLGKIFYVVVLGIWFGGKKYMWEELVEEKVIFMKMVDVGIIIVVLV